jgi:predicted amidohydrolase
MPGTVVAAIQSIARPGDLPASVDDHSRLAARAAERGASLAVFPELSLTGYDRGLTRADAITASDARLRPIQQVADSHHITIVAGAPLESARGLQIGALCFSPHRSPVTYSKRFLHEGEEIAFVPGLGGEPLMVGSESIGIAICAEITHPEHAQEAARRGASIYAASCFITPDGYARDAALLAEYAVRHRMAVLMANYGAATSAWKSAGRSAIWSAGGKLLARAATEGEEIVVAELGAATVQSPRA